MVNRESGTLTVFAFDEDEGLSEHVAPYDAFLYVFEGEALVTVAGTANEMKGGEGIILPAGKPHSLKAVKPFKMLLAMIRS